MKPLIDLFKLDPPVGFPPHAVPVIVDLSLEPLVFFLEVVPVLPGTFESFLELVPEFEHDSLLNLEFGQRPLNLRFVTAFGAALALASVELERRDFGAGLGSLHFLLEQVDPDQ